MLNIADVFRAGIGVLMVGGMANAAVLNVPSGPYPTIQDALDAAVNGDEVVVADGLYIESLFVDTGITLRSASDHPTLCTVAAGAGFIALRINAPNVAVEVRGILFTESDMGAFITPPPLSTTAARFYNCHFTNNDIGLKLSFGDLTLTDCLIQGNLIEGGMEILGQGTATDTVFEGNQDSASSYMSGGGVRVVGGSSSFTGTRLTIRGNSADVDGGGVYAAAQTTVTLQGCTIEMNSATDEGGGIKADTQSAIVIRNTVIQDNDAARGGGVAGEEATMEVVNTVVANNAALAGVGGGLFAEVNSDSMLQNVTFVGNTATVNGDAIFNEVGGTLDGVSLIVKAPGTAIAGSGTTTIQFSLVDGGFAGAGNITGAPGFVDAPAGDFSLLAGSPCIDSGDAFTYSGPAIDLASLPRMVNDPAAPDTGVTLLGAAIDMGAYEFQAPPVSTCPEDSDNDGVVGVLDFLAVLANWGACPVP